MTAHRKRDCARLVVGLTLAMYPGCRPAPGPPPAQEAPPECQSAFAPVEPLPAPRPFEPLPLAQSQARPQRAPARRQLVERSTRRFYGPSGYIGQERRVGSESTADRSSWVRIGTAERDSRTPRDARKGRPEGRKRAN